MKPEILKHFCSKVCNELLNSYYYTVAVDIDLKVCIAGIEAIGNSIVNNFVIDENNKELYNQLALYFIGNTDFKGDLKKGIMLRGATGTGKTLALHIMQKFANAINRSANYESEKNTPKNDFSIIRCKDVYCRYEAGGIDEIRRYKSEKIYCFDDLGEELSGGKNARFYANELNVFEDILTWRYEQFINRKIPTHVTTNFVFSQLETLYGLRLQSRLFEMFNVITVTGDDRRKALQTLIK